MAEHGERQIRLRGVRVHNLKGIDLDVPLGQLVVVTGVSGSGKSSLAFDTLYAEGQRRYIETFSAYTRQFLEKLDRPDADRIEGIPPAIAVGQRVARRSGRSTVGTVTEIQDYLGLLYAKLGRVLCRTCGAEVRPADPEVVVAAIEALPERTRYQIAFPVDLTPDSDLSALATALREEGFLRVRAGGEVRSLDDGPLPHPGSRQIEVVVDRLLRGSEDPSRRWDSIETAFDKGLGRCRLLTDNTELTFFRGWRCSRCGSDHLEPEPRLFRFNNPLGACPACEGFGRVIDLDLIRIVPNPSKSLDSGAIAPWTTPAYRAYLEELLAAAPALGIPTYVPFSQLTPEQVGAIVEGDPSHGLAGLKGFFRALERKSYKLHVRVFLSRWRGYRPCAACGGARLRPEALAVQVGGMNIGQFLALRVSEALARLGLMTGEIAPDERTEGPARRVLEQAHARLAYLDRIGLGYLTLDRPARTLSGGEARRVGLTTALGSGLVNTLFVLDEPSIGLHPRDVNRLIGAVTDLRGAGNSVVVVEHESEIIRSADLLIDIGPGAGDAGGRLLYAGSPSDIGACAESLTAAYLTGRRSVAVPQTRRTPGDAKLTLTGARGNNLKTIDVTFPLGVFCVVTGVSGAGKSTLVEETLYPALCRNLRGESLPGEPFRALRGAKALGDVVLIDQGPIGRSARSNPVTYLKAFDEIRRTFAETHEAKVRNYSASTFSFNVEGGRCNACEGNGYQIIDMQFLPDVLVRCPECQGARYRAEVLEVAYRGKTIAEVLELTVREAFAYFRHRPKVQARLRPLMEVGLDYLRLGQPASTLSGGEAQRLKLALYVGGSAAALTRSAAGPKTLFLLDEPTTGLHPADVQVLLEAFNRLVDLGHSLIVVEHNPDVMACADWIIDLGPGAGDDGGRVIAEGPPEVVKDACTPTGEVLTRMLSSLDCAPPTGHNP
jgi:excinuclease ABC subunit A